MSWWMEIQPDAPAPKRGDLIQSNRNRRKERTWIVLRSVPVRDLRYSIFRARWWELEPDMRMKLYRSAQRNGGQTVWHVHQIARKKDKKPVANFGF
jgi:hypothetical protein